MDLFGYGHCFGDFVSQFVGMHEYLKHASLIYSSSVAGPVVYLANTCM